MPDKTQSPTDRTDSRTYVGVEKYVPRVDPAVVTDEAWAEVREAFNRQYEGSPTEAPTEAPTETLPEAPQEGRKDDTGKIPMELLPPELLFAVASVLGFGCQKYGPRNWEKGMAWGRVFGAAMRHLWCWWGGKGPTTRNFAFGDLDAETAFSHLWHAATCIAFLVAYEERGIGTDDRSRVGVSK